MVTSGESGQLQVGPAGAKEWMVNFRLVDTPENRRKIELLTEHAWLRYGGRAGGMKTKNMSEFLRFAINYYHTHEIKGR